MSEGGQGGGGPQFTTDAGKKRPGCLKLVLIGLGVLVTLGVVGALVGGGDTKDDAKDTATSLAGQAEQRNDKTTTTAASKLFPGRPDSQKEDQERNVGDAARLSGYTATVTKASFTRSLSQFEDKGYIVTEVTIENRDSKAQPYNRFDWKLQTPNGQVIDPGFVGGDQELHSGDLVNGGKVTGRVTFEVGSAKGDFYVIYKPDAYDAARGVWKITI